MNVLKFELKKLWRGKKFSWLFIISLLIVLSTFLPDYIQHERKSELALEEIQPYEEEVNAINLTLRAKGYHDEINTRESKQLVYVEGMALALFNWKNAIYHEEWHIVPEYEHDFLKNLQLFNQHGGEFGTLEGIEKEISVQKNQWLIQNGLSYENENIAISPHLLLKENTKILFNLPGLILLVLLFGNTVTIEKESHTWLTLNTQPIPKWRIIVAKFVSLLFVVLVFQVVSIGLSIIIPILFGNHSLRLDYPQIISTGTEFEIITTFEYMFRESLLFICVSVFSFSIILLLSKWLKNTFSTLIIFSFIMMIGYLISSVFTTFQSARNPFYLLQFPLVINGVIGSIDWIYPSLCFLPPLLG